MVSCPRGPKHAQTHTHTHKRRRVRRARVPGAGLRDRVRRRVGPAPPAHAVRQLAVGSVAPRRRGQQADGTWLCVWVCACACVRAPGVARRHAHTHAHAHARHTHTRARAQYADWAGLADLDDFWTDPAARKMYRDNIQAITGRVNSITGACVSSVCVCAWLLCSTPQWHVRAWLTAPTPHATRAAAAHAHCRTRTHRPAHASTSPYIFLDHHHQ